MSEQPTYDYQGYELNTEENASFEEKRLVQLSRLLAALEKRKSRIEVMILSIDSYESFGEILDEFNLIDARITQVKDEHYQLRQREIRGKMKNRIGATEALIASLFSIVCASGVSAKSGDVNQIAAARLITGTQYPAMVTVGADVMDSSAPLILKSEGTLGFEKCTFIVDVIADRITERVSGKLREVTCYNADGVKFVSGNLNLQDNLVDPSHTVGLRGKIVTKQAGLLRGFGKKLDDVAYVQILAGQKAGIVVHQDVDLISQSTEGQLGSKKFT